jgi:hypothetical protein
MNQRRVRWRYHLTNKPPPGAFRQQGPKATHVLGFKVRCRECETEFVTNATMPITEAITEHKLTAYFPASMHLKSGQIAHVKDAVGVSFGDGSTFECSGCHAVKWVAETQGRAEVTDKKETEQ